MATNLNIDDVTYQLKKDANSLDSKKYYIRAAFPLNYITDNMTYNQAQKVAKSMRQLGYTVIDMTKTSKPS